MAIESYKTLTLLYKKSNIDGSTSPISGATVTCSVTRISDGYQFDSATETFLAAAAVPTTMTEVSPISSPGVYSCNILYDGWQDDTYLFNPEATKSGENPFGYVEVITISSGIISTTVNVDPAPTGFCVAYLFLNDKPATVPTISANYKSIYYNNNVLLPIANTVTYSNATGMLYYTLLQGSTVEFKSISRGLHRTVRIPAVSTDSILLLPEVK